MEIGVFSAVKQFLNLDSIDVIETSCVHDGYDNCEFIIRYEAKKMWLRRLLNIFAFILFFAAMNFVLDKLFAGVHAREKVDFLASSIIGFMMTLIFLLVRYHYSVMNYISNYFDQNSQTIRELQNEREKVNTQQAKSDLATSVSHDIRSPLVALKVIADLPEDDVRKSLLKGVIDRIEKIVADLTNLKSLESSPTVRQRVADLLETAVAEKEFETSLRGDKTVSFEIQVSPQNLTIDINPHQIQRIISNLLNNAIEALGNEGVVLLSGSDSGQFHLLEIKDNGCGIPAAVLPQFLNRGATFGKSGGAGLGLFQCNEYLWKIGGHIKIESGESAGTTVKLYIP